MILRRLLPVALAAAACTLSSCKLVPSEEVATPPPPPETAHSGGRLTVGVTAPGGIDPVNAYEPVGKLISSTMCDTLVTLDPDTSHVREGLVKSMVFSPDGSTLTFTMRRGLHFNDGSGLTTADVDFSYQLLAARSTASYVRGLIEPFAGGMGARAGDSLDDESVLADDEVGGGKAIAQALNDADFQMFVPRSNGGSVRALAEPALAPISKAAYLRDPVAFAKNPVCVGPYHLAAPYQAGDTSLTLVRSDNYYGQNVGYTGGGRGYLDKIVFRIFPSADAARRAYHKGQVDLVAVPRGAQVSSSDADLVRGPATGVEFLGFPTPSAAFANTDFRQALSLGLDRTAIAAALGQGEVPATGFLPAALQLASGDNAIRTRAVRAEGGTSVTFEGCGPLLAAKPDRVEAVAAMSRARQAPGFSALLKGTIPLYVNTDGHNLSAARLVAKQWGDLFHLDFKVIPLTWVEYLRKATSGPGFDGVFRLSWSANAVAPSAVFNDPQSFLGPLFTAEASSNWGHWRSTEFDFAFNQDAGSTVDVRERGEVFKRLEKMLCDELPMIPVAFTGSSYFVRTSKFATARSSYVSASTGLPVLREIYLK